jgi:hypothetical protein
MQNLRKSVAVLRIRMVFAVAVGLLFLASGCSEYKPAGPTEEEPQKVDASTEKAG